MPPDSCEVLSANSQGKNKNFGVTAGSPKAKVAGHGFQAVSGCHAVWKDVYGSMSKKIKVLYSSLL